MLPPFDTIMRMPQARDAGAAGVEIGRSREGRPIRGLRAGNGVTRVSLIAGCHADEPVGPRLLERLAHYLTSLDPSHELLTRYAWWVVAHINPDGAERNGGWSKEEGGAFDSVAYLRHAVREEPGDDIEFGFPRSRDDHGARPEPRAVYDWWAGDPAPFALHASLHGMAFAAGPWFLVDPAWAGRCDVLKAGCRAEVSRLGYALHDVQRHGEKGFERIERGFCTRPSSDAMARHFLDRGDPDTASRFRPSSMETARAFGGDALTLVSEVPLFITPGVGETIEPVDPVAETWRERIAAWKQRPSVGDDTLAAEIAASGLHAVPVEHQMRLQWAMIRAGLDQAARGRVS